MQATATAGPPPVTVASTTVPLPGQLDIPGPAYTHRRARSIFRVPRIGRRTRPCDGCPRSPPGVRPPRAFPLRSHRRRSRRPLARVARPARHRLRHHGRAAGCHRGTSSRPRSAGPPRSGCNRSTRCARRSPFPSTPACTTPARPCNRLPSPPPRAAPPPLPIAALRSPPLRGWTTTSPSSAPCIAGQLPPRFDASRLIDEARRFAEPGLAEELAAGRLPLQTIDVLIDGYRANRRGRRQRAVHRVAPLPEGEHRARSARCVSGANRPAVARPGACAGADAPAR